jgi:hypothetical protein
MLVLVGAESLWGAENLATDDRQPAQHSSEESGNSSHYGQDLLTILVEAAPIPQAMLQSLLVLFDRNRFELERLANAHQDIIPEVIGIAVELLPTLKTIDTDGSQVRLNRKTYDRVTRLMERCERLASPELAKDLRKAKTIVDSRMQEGDQETLIIDLKD